MQIKYILELNHALNLLVKNQIAGVIWKQTHLFLLCTILITF